jgi:hypothetical protein
MIAIRLNPWVIFSKAGLHFETDGIPADHSRRRQRDPFCGRLVVLWAEFAGRRGLYISWLFYVISSLESPTAPFLPILIGMNQLGSVHPRFSRVVAAISRPISRLLLAAIR